MAASSTSFPPAHLVLGPEQLLVARAVEAAIGAVRRIEPDAEVTRIKAAELTAPTLLEMVGPSLFTEARAVVVESAQDASQDVADAIESYLSDPAEGVVLVVVHSGGGRSKAAKALPKMLRKAGATVAECDAITKPAEREQFVRAEVKRAGGRIEPEALTELVDAVGTDLAELAAAAGQLLADSGGKIDVETVRRYHKGRADVTGFAVAEKVVTGERAAALETLRWAQQIGVPHVLIADAMADAVRTVAKVVAAGPGNPNQLAGELGMPPWKVRKARGQSRGWSRPALAESMQIAARLNADVKGAAADADYAVERAAMDIMTARSRR